MKLVRTMRGKPPLSGLIPPTTKGNEVVTKNGVEMVPHPLERTQFAKTWLVVSNDPLGQREHFEAKGVP